MQESAPTLLHTPLHDAHVAFGARMVEFAGWEMPISYRGITEEHVHTRSACSMFDVSHMGRLKLSGTDCETFLNRLCTRNLSGAEVGRSYYAHICREDGGILDDVIVSRFATHWGIVCNASNRDKVVAWIEMHRAGADVAMEDQTRATAMLAFQGPRAMDLASEVSGQDLSTIKRYRHRTFEFLGMPITIYRSGYTGEDGVEVVLPAGAAAMLLPRVLGTPDAPHPEIRPAGLGARDTLRIEASMPLYGHELSEDWDSLTAGQAWCVDLQKEFIGASAMRELQARGLPRQVIGLELDGRRIARQHQPVHAADGVGGEITSGTLSPTLGKSIAMAMVSTAYCEPGTALDVELSGKRVPARVVPMPFYKRGK